MSARNLMRRLASRPTGVIVRGRPEMAVRMQEAERIGYSPAGVAEYRIEARLGITFYVPRPDDLPRATEQAAREVSNVVFRDVREQALLALDACCDLDPHAAGAKKVRELIIELLDMVAA